MRHPKQAITLARQAARAIGLRVAAIDMFVDIGGKPDANEIIEVNSNPSIRLLEDSDRGDLILKIWHHTLLRHGTAVVFDLPKYGDGICLARLAALLEALGIDRARLQRISVVVTGSNGKGSTAAMCARIGRAYGLRTGLFTSPHLVRFNERIQVDGAEIGDDAFARLQRRVEAAIAEVSKRLGEKFGAFEALFALACLHFQESECDFAVFEAGIGGRYDPVRLVGAHETCVTSVDYEHVELLGNSLELIVSDKSDACAAGGTIVYGENCRGLRPHLVEYNRGRGCTPLFVRDDIRIDNEVTAASGQHFDFQFGYHDFRGLETEPARRVSVQQRGHRRSRCSCCGCNASSRARLPTGSKPRYAPACATRVGPAGSKSSSTIRSPSSTSATPPTASGNRWRA